MLVVGSFGSAPPFCRPAPETLGEAGWPGIRPTQPGKLSRSECEFPPPLQFPGVPLSGKYSPHCRGRAMENFAVCIEWAEKLC